MMVDVVTPEYVRVMALYNRWQNERLYETCGALSDTARKADRGMFFRSIHNTLNHILVVDRVILRMVREGRPSPFEPRAVPYDSFETLRRERISLDAEILALADERKAEWLSEPMVFHSERLKRERRMPRAFMLCQLFNHQTHHRSQVTSELHKLGIDYGVTDMPQNPYVDY
jgi:uncharacterized damage-inducible protein DinB